MLSGFPIDFQADPRDPYRIFSNNYGGGNVVSEDGGRSWTAASKGYTGAQVRDIAADPASPGRVVVACRSGAFKSLDGGGSWTGLNVPPNWVMEWTAVAIDPKDPQHLLSANNWRGRIVESKDGGTSWVDRSSPVGNGFGFGALAFAPSDPQVAYAGTAAYRSAGQFYPGLPAKGIWVSRDGGAGWTPANDAVSQTAHVNRLAVHPADADTVFAATTNNGLLRTTNGGMTWRRLEGLPYQVEVRSVGISPVDPRLVFAGTQSGFYRSEDGGETWGQVTSGLPPETSVTDIAFDPSDALVVYLSDARSGVYVSNDGGREWLLMSQGLRTRAVNRLAVSSDGRHLYAATEGEGVYRLDADGTPPAPAMEALVFLDVPPDAPYSPAILGLYAHDVIAGYGEPGGPLHFRPDNPVWRAQFAKMICGTIELPVAEDLSAPFTDLGPDDTASLYPHEYVAAAAMEGITKGTGGTSFTPYGDITRAQVITMIVRGAQNLAGVPLQEPPDRYAETGELASFSDPTHGHNVHLAEWNGLLEGIDLAGWDPWRSATRGEVAQMLWNLWLGMGQGE